MEQASQEFWDAFESGGAPTAACTCGKRYVAAGPQSCIGETELEEANRENNTVVDIHSDSIGFVYLSGITLVYDCPCGTAKRYEHFLVDNMESILKYYKARLAKVKAQTDQGLDLLNSL